MITPFFQTDQSLIWAMLWVGTFSTPRHSYALGDFGRLPLLLPERDALNLKAFCPGLISPYSPGIFISRPPVMPGFSSPALQGAGARAPSHVPNTAAASSRPEFLRLEKSWTEIFGPSAAISPSTR